MEHNSKDDNRTEGLRHIHTSRPAYPSTNSTYPADPYPAIIAIPSPSHVQFFRST